MDSKTKTLIVAAMLASIAVLAFLPADDVSAEPTVSYVGTATADGDEYSILSMTLDATTTAASVTVDNKYIGYHVDLNGFTSADSVPMVSLSDYTAAVIPDGTYLYVINDVNTGAQLGTGSITIAAASVETSDEVRAAVVVDTDGVYLMMVAKDGKAIPDGTIDVTYSYTKTVEFHGQQRVTSATDSFTQEFAADGNAYAYVLLDFEDKASENYDSVFGISAASFTYGQTTVKTGSAAFALPPLAEAGA